MNPWEVLGISQTSDEGTVRRAYAKLLKIKRPEDDMQAFQTLRMAFEQALAICRSHQKGGAQFDFCDEYEAIEEIAAGDRPCPSPVQPLEDSQRAISIHDFVAAFNALAKDYASYPDTTKWMTLLERAEELNYWERRQLGRMLAEILPEFCHLPSFVWMKLEQSFNWERDRGLLGSLYSDVELDRLKNLGKAARLMCSEEILPCPGGSEYLRALSEVYDNRELIKNDDIKNRLNGLSINVQSNKPPAALRLHLSLLHRIGDWQTLSLAHRFYGGHYSDLFTSLLRGTALRHLGDYKGALNIFEEILRQNPNQADALRFSALCMEHMGDASSALRRYRFLLEISPEDVYSSFAIKRLIDAHTDKRRSWRDWLFKIGDLFLRILPYIFIPAMIILAVMGFLFYFTGIPNIRRS